MQKLSEAEQSIMVALWEADEPSVPRAYFDCKLADRSWSANAMNAFLTRLEEKGYVQSAKSGKNKLYTPTVNKDDYLKSEGRSVLERLYNNSLKNFLVSVSSTQELGEGDIDEIQDFLEGLKRGGVRK